MDTVNNKLLVFGGGHTDSADNSVYAFDVAAGTWARVFGPTANAIITASAGIESSGYYATNTGGGTPDTTQPRSRHTYNMLVFASSKMYSLVSLFMYSGGLSANNFDVFNPSTNLWSQVGTNPMADFNFDGWACPDASGNIWFYGGSSQGFLKHYNIAGNTWTDHGDIFTGTGALDNTSPRVLYHPTLNRAYAVGDTRLGYWDLTPGAGNLFYNAVTPVGGASIIAAEAPGVAYHPGTDRFICWAGGVDVYSLNASTGVFTLLPAHPSSSVTPASPATNGTFGRFQYSAASGLFVLANTTLSNVLKLQLA